MGQRAAVAAAQGPRLPRWASSAGRRRRPLFLLANPCRHRLWLTATHGDSSRIRQTLKRESIPQQDRPFLSFEAIVFSKKKIQSQHPIQLGKESKGVSNLQEAETTNVGEGKHTQSSADNRVNI